MCGIFGYLGTRDARDIIVNGLQALEYRGYDSAGIAIREDGKALKVAKKKGKVSLLKEAVESGDFTGKTGLGHTRWATHGVPSVPNCHPHFSNDKRLALVHNGIIENERSLRLSLQEKGYTFASETDSETVVHLIYDVMKTTGLPLADATRQAMQQVVGAYGIVVIDEQENIMLTIRKGSPIILAIGEGEFYVASDASAVIPHTRDVIYLEDGQMAVCTPTDYKITDLTLEGNEFHPEIVKLEQQLQDIQKGGYDHFMLKEIYEQPAVMNNCIRGRLDFDQKAINLGGFQTLWNGRPGIEWMREADRIIICACGTSWHAALLGEYLIEDLARVPVEVEYASEFRYRNPVLKAKKDIIFVVSQSGETADTLEAVRIGQEKGCMVVGIINTVGSTMARLTDMGVYIHAGPEIGVASTKAFTAQVMSFLMVAVALGKGGNLSDEQVVDYMKAMQSVPELMQHLLDTCVPQLQEVSKVFRLAANFIFLGRGYNFPVALEGALKLKEISYIHAEGYPAAEMKHGPIALVDQFMPVVFVCMKDAVYDKVVANIKEVQARKGSVIAITNEGNTDLDDICDAVIYIPASANDLVQPLLTVIPLQLMSYYIATARGCNVDQPRNLAKSVTVE